MLICCCATKMENNGEQRRPERTITTPKHLRSCVWKYFGFYTVDGKVTNLSKRITSHFKLLIFWKSDSPIRQYVKHCRFVYDSILFTFYAASLMKHLTYKCIHELHLSNKCDRGKGKIYFLYKSSSRIVDKLRKRKCYNWLFISWLNLHYQQVQLFELMYLGRTHTGQSVPCLNTSDPQSPVCLTSVSALHCAQAQHALPALARLEEEGFDMSTSKGTEPRHRCDYLWRIHLRFRHKQHSESE